MSIEENSHDEVSYSLTLLELRKGIAQQRFAEAWTLYKSYGIVHGSMPNVPSGRNISYPEVLAAYFPEEFRTDRRACPEGYAVQIELQKDMDALETIVRGEYSFSRSSKLYIRDYTIETDAGLIDCAHLALAGILTPEAYAALQEKDFRALVKDSYGVDPLRVAFGFGMRLIERHFDPETYILFGKYHVNPGKRKDQLCNIPGEVAAEMLRDASSVILLTELSGHIARMYNTGEKNIESRVADVCRKPQDWIREDDPHYSFSFSLSELFGTNVHGAVSLSSVNALINVFRRDRRIVETHRNMIETGESIGVDRNAIKEWILTGKMFYRNLSVLPTLSGLKTHFICDYDLQEKVAVTDPSIEYLAFCEAKKLDPQTVVSYRRFRRDYTEKDLTKTASPEYLAFCDERKLNPIEITSYNLFRRRERRMRKNERLDAFYKEGIDWRYNGRNFWDLKKEEIVNPELYAALFEQNRERIAAEYGREEWRRGNPLVPFIEEGIFYVSLVSPFVPDQWASSWSAREDLKRRKRGRKFLRTDYISLKDALELHWVAKMQEEIKATSDEKDCASAAETVSNICIAVPPSQRQIIRSNSAEGSYSRDLAQYRPLRVEENRALGVITHGDAFLSEFIPEHDPDGICSVAEKFLHERIRADPEGALAKDYGRYQKLVWIMETPEKEQGSMIAYILRDLFYTHNLMPNYLALLREHLEETRDATTEKEEYAVPGFVALYDALMIVQGKQRNRTKGHQWSGPIAFSPELSDLVEKHRSRIAIIYHDYSKAAERAKELLYLGNLRLVLPVTGLYEHPDLHFLDKVQEGNLGLRRAVEMYDYRMKKFSTCAFPWVRSFIQRAYTKAGPVRLPSHIYETVSLVSKVQKIQRERGENGTQDSAVKWISDGEVKSPTLNVGRALSGYRNGKNVRRLDAPRDDEDDTLLHDTIGESASAPDVIYETRNRRKVIAGALDALSEEQRLVLQLRFKLHPNYDEALTLEEAGKIMGCSRDTAAHLERTALNALRTMQRADLSVFVEA